MGWVCFPKSLLDADLAEGCGPAVGSVEILVQLNLDQCVANLPALEHAFWKNNKNKQSMLGLSFQIILLWWIFIYLFILEKKDILFMDMQNYWAQADWVG